MSYIINGYKPEKLFRYFEDLAAIPHGSGNESAVADWLVAFAAEWVMEFTLSSKILLQAARAAFDAELAKSYSDAADYREIATKALAEMLEQTGTPQLDADGILVRGTVVRHLVFPVKALRQLLHL